MKATELRIGNWVRIKTTQHESNVTALRAYKVWLVDNPRFDECGWSEGLEPIPLNRDWKIKFGIDPDVKYLQGINSELIASNRGFWKVYLDSIEHVHKLQNLYFALTGSELQIK